MSNVAAANQAPASVFTSEGLAHAVSTEVGPYLERTASSEYSPNQHLLAAMVSRAHDEFFYKEMTKAWINAAVCVAIGCIAIYTAFWLLHFLKVDALLFVLAAVFLFFLYFVPMALRSHTISIKRNSEGKMYTLWIGMLIGVINPGLLLGMTIFLATGIVTQTALIRFTSNHLGISNIETVGDALIITMRSVFHIPIDLAELYFGKFGWTRAEKLPFWPGTVVNIFRIVYDGLLAAALYFTWQRWRIRRLYKTRPQTERFDDLLDWLEQISRDKANWGRILHNEMVFNMITEEYLRNNFELVRELGRQFVCIDVTNEVRKVFVDPRTNQLLFELREEKGHTVKSRQMEKAP